MINNWQRDNLWKNNTIGTSNSTFGDFGCLISSIGDLCDKNPIEINDYLNSVNGYANGDEVIWTKLSGLLKNEQKYPCIARVQANYMHFVVALDDNMILDPYYGDKVSVTSRYDGIAQLYPWTTPDNINNKESEDYMLSEEQVKEMIKAVYIHLGIKDYDDEEAIENALLNIKGNKNDKYAGSNWIIDRINEAKNSGKLINPNQCNVISTKARQLAKQLSDELNK